ncbi:MAG: hypothetical protein H6701_04370 [Myxococcales bacterium]|nr:hypothetical protein [Myxococcales bacterium]
MADHDWAALYGQLEAATAEYDRAELVELLRDLIRDLVIDALPTGAPTAASPDLSGMDFARLIGWLKRNLSVPELALFEVDGDRVIVEADGPRVLSTGRDAPRPTAGWPAAAPPPAPRATDAFPATTGPAAGPAAPAPSPVQQAQTARRQEEDAKKAAEKLSPGFRGLEFD